MAFLLLCCLPAGVSVLRARPAAPDGKAESHLGAARSPREFLASPRETLRTLYFSIIAYDHRPELMDEAVACLELGPDSVAQPAESARLAIDLEQVLRTLCVCIREVPEKPDRDRVTIVEDRDFKITLERGKDGLWRFDRETVQRIPAMARKALARFRDLQGERARLEDDFTDPSATMRRFLLDTMAHNFYSAARCLDLGAIEPEERGEKGPCLARQLAFVVQRRGWVFLQEIPNHPSGPPFTWHADRIGRIVLERIRLENGKEAWLFSKKTVRNIPAMYRQARDHAADPRFVRLGVALPPLNHTPGQGACPGSRQPPPKVPPQLGSPRALLQAFFRVMDAAETHDSRLADALVFLDLRALPQADRQVQGAKLATKLEAVLRKIDVELSSLPDDWNAPPQVLGERQGVRIEIVRQKSGWCFSQHTVSQVPAFFDRLLASDKAGQNRASHLDSARDTMSTFLSCMRRGEYDQAAECLDLSRFRPATRDEVGPVLAYKLKYVIDRIGRVYIQEVPDTPDGHRYVFYRGELGRIVIARQSDGPRKGCWLFTAETVAMISRMFRAVIDRPVSEAVVDGALPPPRFWQAPGLWVRFRVPQGLRPVFWRLHLYQWLGLALALVVSIVVPRLVLAKVQALIAMILHKSGSALTRPFVSSRLRPLTWVVGFWLLFVALGLLDLPVRFTDAIRPVRTFGMAGLLGWLGVQLVDLATAVYTNSELLRPHRSLSDMVVPVSMRALKGGILLVVAVYVIYQLGEGELLSRFLTALGVAGLAASLAAQDAMKNFFSTLLLIGERTFKIGDRVSIGGQEGTVEQVGFRATRLRTLDGSLLTVPNATIASAAIDNMSTRAFSRCQTSVLLGSGLGAAGVLALREQIREWLLKHPKVHPDKVEVHLGWLAGQGLQVTVDLHLVAVSSSSDEKELKDQITCELLRLSAELMAAEGPSVPRLAA
jgi:MscS family membrane protein